MSGARAPFEETLESGFRDPDADYYTSLYRYCLRLTRNPTNAEDLVQTTVLKALKGWDTYDPTRNVIKWITTIAINTYFNQLKSIGYKLDRFNTHYDLDNIAVECPLGEANRFGLHLLVEDAIAAAAKLPDSLRTPMEMYLQGQKPREIAEELGITANAARARISRAKRQLKDVLGCHSYRQFLATREDPVFRPAYQSPLQDRLLSM